MDCVLMKNGGGVLGLAVLGDKRKIGKVTYLTDCRHLSITLEDGTTEELNTDIDNEFEQSLYTEKKVFIGHFENSLEKDPTDEYYVPLEL